MPMLPFVSGGQENVVYNNQEVPKEMNIFENLPRDFLPPGKTFKDLTPAEYQLLKSQYRFSPYRPGIYQGITGIGNSI